MEKTKIQMERMIMSMNKIEMRKRQVVMDLRRWLMAMSPTILVMIRQSDWTMMKEER